MCTCLEYLNREEKAEQKFVRLEQAPADVRINSCREAVVEVLQPSFQLRRRRSLADGLAEKRAEPRQRVLVHRVNLVFRVRRRIVYKETGGELRFGKGTGTRATVPMVYHTTFWLQCYLNDGPP